MGSIKYKWKELDDKSSSQFALNCNYLSRLLKVCGQFDSCFAAKIFHFWYLETDENLIARLIARACDELGLTVGAVNAFLMENSPPFIKRRIFHMCVTCHAAFIYSTLTLVGKITGRGFIIFAQKKKKNNLRMVCQQLRDWPRSYSLKSVLRSTRKKKKQSATTLTELLARWLYVRLNTRVKIDLGKWRKKKVPDKVVGMTTAVTVCPLCEWRCQCQLHNRKKNCVKKKKKNKSRRSY